MGMEVHANGKAYGDAVELTASGNWVYTWTDLPKRADGVVIQYTVKEVGRVKGYLKGSVSGNMTDGYVITNVRLTLAEELEYDTMKSGAKYPADQTVNPGATDTTTDTQRSGIRTRQTQETIVNNGGEEIVNGDVTTTERNTERTRTTRGGDPKTGDTTPIGLMLPLMGLSLAAILLAVRRRKRN